MPAVNTFGVGTSSSLAPAEHAFAITPSDTVDLAYVTRGLYVGSAGNVSVDLVGGETAVVFVAIAIGMIHPIRATRVRATGTTASSLVGVY